MLRLMAPETASIAGGLGLQVMDDTTLLAEAFADMGYDLENVKRSGARSPARISG